MALLTATHNLPIHTKWVEKPLTQLLVMPILKMPGIICPTTEKGEYVHWDKLRHLTVPGKLNHEQWWFAIKLARTALYKQLPFIDKYKKLFVLATTEPILNKLHIIDQKTDNAIRNTSSIFNTQMQDTYLVQSLIEEAITSSQLEGASTTRKVAKEMLLTKRKPQNLSEKMIFNNYQAIQFVREMKNEALTTEIILQAIDRLYKYINIKKQARHLLLRCLWI
jgi:hypothetical protein